MAIVDLTSMKVGEIGIIVEIQGGHGLMRRTQVLGLRQGKKVTKVSSQFLRGPITVRIDNLQVAIGFGMARKIIVEIER